MINSITSLKIVGTFHLALARWSEITNSQSPVKKWRIKSEEKKLSDKNADANLVTYIEELQKIDVHSKLAKLNTTSITDNNGGRILL